MQQSRSTAPVGPSTGAATDTAADVWGRLLECFQRHRARLEALLEELSLSLGDMRALMALDSETPQPMRCLADVWSCDASNATWIIDRLEQRGLVDRRVLPTDRRVKAVVLTRSGRELKDELLRRLHEPPPEIVALPASDLRELLRVLSRVYPA